MDISRDQLALALPLAIAAAIGLLVGLEREWSGHAVGARARFAGVRTFFLQGLLGGSAGLLAIGGYELLAAAVAAGGLALSVSAYIVATRAEGADRDGTTEVAAILVVALGAVATAASWLLAAGAASVMVLALNEKQRLHGAIGRLHQEELRAALQFAALALVVLPLLPKGPFLGWMDIRPRALWMIVLLFCALNFAGFLAKRSAGEGRGYLLTGLLGGVISSTAVTFGFARYSKQHAVASSALAMGVVGACTVLVPRVLVISWVLNPDVATRLTPLILPAGIVGTAVVAYAWRSEKTPTPAGDASSPVGWLASDDTNPLRLWVAIQLAVIFQLAMIGITYARNMWSVKGLYGTAVILGLTNADALTVSMSTASTAVLPILAAKAIAIGILANTLVKLAISVATGSARYRLVAGALLLLMAGSIAGTLMIM